MKRIQEQIEVMTHYLNGGEVETLDLTDIESKWDFIKSPSWNWVDFDYRIKEQKKTITIEKWLYQLDKENDCIAVEGTPYTHLLRYSQYKKLKLLESKEIEL